MNKYKNIIERIASYDNILLSIKEIIKGKKIKYKSSQIILSDLNNFCEKISNLLLTGNYKLSKYREFNITEQGKERNIQSLCIQDRIVLHAIMNILGKELFVKSFIKNTFASIKDRGIIKGLTIIRHDLKDIYNTKYCLKLDIKKFYNSINHDVLKTMLKTKINDKILLKILYHIIDSFDNGLPLGYHSSQYLGNFYLSGLDRYIIQDLKVKYYYRYCDDIVILSRTKQELHNILNNLRYYINDILKLEIKNNYQIFPVDDRGIDFLGYVIRHDYIKIRKRIKLKALKRLNYLKSQKRITEVLASISGWISHCDENYNKNRTLIKKIKTPKTTDEYSNMENIILNTKSIKSFKSLGIKQNIPIKVDAKRVSTNDIININIILIDAIIDVNIGKFDNNEYKNKKSIIIFNYPDEPGVKYKFLTSAIMLVEAAERMKNEDLFPVSATVKKVNNLDGSGKSYLIFE